MIITIFIFVCLGCTILKLEAFLHWYFRDKKSKNIIFRYMFFFCTSKCRNSLKNYDGNIFIFMFMSLQLKIFLSPRSSSLLLWDTRQMFLVQFWLFYCAMNIKKIYLFLINLIIINELYEKILIFFIIRVKFFGWRDKIIIILF